VLVNLCAEASVGLSPVLSALSINSRALCPPRYGPVGSLLGGRLVDWETGWFTFTVYAWRAKRACSEGPARGVLMSARFLCTTKVVRISCGPRRPGACKPPGLVIDERAPKW